MQKTLKASDLCFSTVIVFNIYTYISTRISNQKFVSYKTEVLTQRKSLNSHCHNAWFHKITVCKTFGKFPTHFCFRHLFEESMKHIIYDNS